MPRIDNETFYTSAIEKYGTTAKGVNWHSKDNQNIRFDVILKMLPDDLSKSTIADAGCGFGDFYTYMSKKNKTPKKYIGIDSIFDMYSIASNNTAQEIIMADICKDEIPSADYYVCSGAMNILNSFETHLFIRNCFNACRHAFVFNVLHGDRESKTYNYLTTKQIKQIAADLGAKRIEIKDDYLESDITAVFYKNDRGDM